MLTARGAREPRVEVGTSLEDASETLVEDLVGPPRLVQAGSCQPEEEVAERCGVQHVRVEHRDRAHRCLNTRVAGPGLQLSARREPSYCGDLCGPIGEHVSKTDASLVHRSSGAELVYDAYNVDLSAGD